VRERERETKVLRAITHQNIITSLPSYSCCCCCCCSMTAMMMIVIIKTIITKKTIINIYNPGARRICECCIIPIHNTSRYLTRGIHDNGYSSRVIVRDSETYNERVPTRLQHQTRASYFSLDYTFPTYIHTK